MMYESLFYPKKIKILHKYVILSFILSLLCETEIIFYKINPFHSFKTAAQIQDTGFLWEYTK